MIRVWDALLRSLHWLLAVAVLTAWFSGHLLEHWFAQVHHTAGYVAGAVVVVRVLWGFAGPRHARFASFVRGPRATAAYAREVAASREPRYLGHNPLGGWMVVALLVAVAAAVITGMLFISDWLWGYGWLADLHEALAWLLMVLVIGHWAGVAFTGLRHRENLVTSMFSGMKRAASERDVP
ncbi:cytochrome b/b6 domain-containing protein [Pelomonas sp. KK5]|uniref:cytochrome b/b6 domain-containing protein n=1 Tax=Pelomonas sp. KK5 TaxID=1855730 RepID=UPI001E513587|nr:cytochrome b/b6 domain-containing protein [Pelomonas sp. KK5]